MDLTAEQIAKQLGAATKSGTNWSCRCPAHEDKRASLSIGYGRDGKVVVHCHAGCSQDDVVNALKIHGLWQGAKINPPRALPPPPVQINIGQGRGQIVATYDYTDEDGELLYQAVRYEPKDFRQRKPLPNGSWSWSIKDVRRVVYRLPAVLEAVSQGKTIYVCEGEKDVHTAESMGLVATCNAMGADNGNGNKWFAEFADVLVNSDVVIIPDNDVAGERHAEWVIQTLTGKAKSVRVAVPQSGKDLTDWVSDGATVQDIEQHAVDAFATDGSSDLSTIIEKKEPLFVSVGELVDHLQPINWLVEDYIEQDSLALVYGAPASGKSFVTVDIACCVATGTAWHGRPVQQGSVFYIAGEGHNGMARRFAAWQKENGVALKDAPLYKSRRAVSIFNQEAALGLYEEVKALAESTGVAPKLVVIDTVARNFGDGDENKTDEMGKFIEHIDSYIRVPFGCNVLLVHHSGHNMDRARGSSALKAALDSEYQVAKEEGLITFVATKMKDAEQPADMAFRFKVVELGEVGGVDITSVVLEENANALDFKVAVDSAGESITAKTVIEVIQRGWLPVDELKEAWNCTKATAGRAIQRCAERGLLIKDGRGYSLTEKASNALSVTGRTLTKQDKPIWKRGQE